VVDPVLIGARITHAQVPPGSRPDMLGGMMPREDIPTAGPQGPWFFASDLHGRRGRYRALLDAIARERPAAVLLGGDLLPHAFAGAADFLPGWLGPALADLRDRLGAAYPQVVAICGNDDPRALEPQWRELQAAGLWTYLAGEWTDVGGVPVLGYPWVPPTPFALKDWELYDVSRFTDPGCVAPDAGRHSVEVDRRALHWRTIAGDLKRLAAGRELDTAVLLCHGPPHGTALDTADLHGKAVDHAPLDVHVGSIALRRLVTGRRPRLVLSGHVHEAARLTGVWRERLDDTWLIGACTDGPELGLVRLDPSRPAEATRELLPAHEDDPPAGGGR
jgi:Icc-related predicted phosphoesterase